MRFQRGNFYRCNTAVGNIWRGKMRIYGRKHCYFVENGQIVLLDYKTDYVDELSELSERYGVQMQLYKKAAENVTGMKVKECLIYSVQKGRTIKVL